MYPQKIKNNYSTFTTFEELLEKAYENVHPEWLTDNFKNEFETTLRVIHANSKDANVQFCPNIKYILEPFKYIKPNDVNVVILGQDPYPKLEHAVGIAFHANGEQKASLKAFKKCLVEHNHEVGVGWSLKGWINQGVLLTNISLTTEEYNSNAHAVLWEGVVNILLKLITKDSVALILGKAAKRSNDSMPCKHKIYHMHPAERTGTFYRKNIFGEVNAKLIELNKKNIDWKFTQDLL